MISCGNFHGQPLALALDFLAIAVNELGNISERRIERLVNPALNNGLPAFLTENGGLNSGLMLLQYAAAALVSEGKVLAHPASVDSIPTSGNQEDHVSMGSIAAYKGRQVVRNIAWVIAAELLAAARAMRLSLTAPAWAAAPLSGCLAESSRRMTATGFSIKIYSLFTNLCKAAGLSARLKKRPAVYCRCRIRYMRCIRRKAGMRKSES